MALYRTVLYRGMAVCTRVTDGADGLARSSVTSHYMNAELVASDDSNMLNGRLYKFPWKTVFQVNYIQREQKLNWLKRPEQHKNNTIVFKRKNLIKQLIRVFLKFGRQKPRVV
jgi:hypothetical protein